MTKSKHHWILLISIFIGLLLISYGTFIDFTNFNNPSSKDLLGLVLSFISSIMGMIFIVLEVEEKKSMFIIGIIGSLSRIVAMSVCEPRS